MVQQAPDFQRLRLRERAAKDGEVLRKHRHAPSVDTAKAGDDTIPRVSLLIQIERDMAMDDVRPDLLEGAAIEKAIDTLPRRELPTSVLRDDSLLAAA